MSLRTASSSPPAMRLRPTLLALAVGLAAAASSAAAQVAAPAARPAVATQPATRPAATNPASAIKPASGAKPATPAAPATKSEPVDINTATTADLKAIPGIGDVYAAKIIARRPYHAKDDLARKKVLPANVYAKVKDRIIARQH